VVTLYLLELAAELGDAVVGNEEAERAVNRIQLPDTSRDLLDGGGARVCDCPISCWYGNNCEDDVPRAAMGIWEVRVDGYRVIYLVPSAEGVLTGDALRV
jgi:hypothetical protein